MAKRSSEVAIFWDFGSCPALASSQWNGYTVVRSIRTLALRLGVIKSFRAYLSITQANKESTTPALALRSELQSSGVSLTDAAGGKNVSDKMLLVDMFAYAFDRPNSSDEEPPTTPTLVLITADPSFAYGLSILRMRNYRIALITPDPAGNPHCLGLVSQADFYLEWPWDVAEVAKDGMTIPPTTGYSGTERSHDPLVNSRQSTDLEDSMNASSKPSSTYPCQNKDPAETRSSAVPPIITEDVAERVETSRNLLLHSQQTGWGAGSISQFSQRPPPTENRSPTDTTVQSIQGGSLSSALDTSTVDTETAASSSPNIQSHSVQFPQGEEPPSYSQSYTPLLPACKQDTPPVEVIRRPPPPPPQFSLLIELLRFWRTKGQERPLRSTLALELVARDGLIYRKAGTDRFAQYSQKAQNLGIIELGGWQGTAWISLHPAYR